jgi:hypothetical protein
VNPDPLVPPSAPPIPPDAPKESDPDVIPEFPPIFPSNPATTLYTYIVFPDGSKFDQVVRVPKLVNSMLVDVNAET